MKIVLFGATGMVGSRILQELISRGHQVTAVVRNVDGVASNPNVVAVAGDILDSGQVAGSVKGADAVVTAYSPGTDPNGIGKLVDATRSLIAGLKQAGVRRVLMVGGAGSLNVAPGVTLIDSGHLPAEWMPIAVAHRDALAVLRESGLDWTSLCPAAFIQPGERTGKFRLGENDLLVDESGASRISAEDYAIAMVNEVEEPRFLRKRFTAAY